MGNHSLLEISTFSLRVQEYKVLNETRLKHVFYFVCLSKIFIMHEVKFIELIPGEKTNIQCWYRNILLVDEFHKFYDFSIK
jgi:hypothetical protein